MKKKNLKAQLAVETLLIYGIAILVVMLAIGALIAFGVLDLGSLLPDQCQLGDGLTCENYVVSNLPSGQDTVQLEFRNTLGKNIDSITVNIQGEDNNQGIWQCTDGTHGFIENGGLTSIITLNCDIKIPAGKKIQGLMTVTFQPTGSQINRTITGNIRAPVT